MHSLSRVKSGGNKTTIFGTSIDHAYSTDTEQMYYIYIFLLINNINFFKNKYETFSYILKEIVQKNII